MKVAVFGDVHGNLIALNRFIDAVEDVADAYVCLGDTVNYGPWGDECLARILGLQNVTVLAGNHERLFLNPDEAAEESRLVSDFLEHSMKEFSSFNVIRGLPSSTEVARYVCTHTIGSKSIYADTELEIDRDYIIGHSHHQYSVERSGFLLVNPGSVGQNRAFIDMIDYLMLDTADLRLSFASIPYEVDLFLSELERRHYPQHCIDYYRNKPRRFN